MKKTAETVILRRNRKVRFELVRGPWSGLIAGMILIAANSPLEAQVGSKGEPVSVRGKITSVKGPQLIVAAPAGDVQVKVDDTTIIRNEIAIKFSDITAGMYLGTTAEKQPDGTFRASEVHVFSEDQRGTGEGHRPMPALPNSTMTNANVEKVEDFAVRDVQGRMMSLKYKSGEVKVLVPPDTPVVKRVPGDRALLKAGVEVSVTATRADDGTLSASQITVRASGR
jgi:hypothetical protein